MTGSNVAAGGTRFQSFVCGHVRRPTFLYALLRPTRDELHDGGREVQFIGRSA